MEKMKLFSGMKLNTLDGYIIVQSKHFNDCYCEEITIIVDDDGNEQECSEYRILTFSDIASRLHEYSGKTYKLEWKEG